MTTELLDATGDELLHAVHRATTLLNAGELVAFPTETVYGLGADAFNPDAIRKVFLAKGRPADNPLIVHVSDLPTIERCAEVDDRVALLVKECMPGPLTLVLPSRKIVPSIARAGLPTVAVRIPDHPVALAVLKAAGPLVAPSANLSGRPSPTTAAHVHADLSGRIAAILDGGPCRVGIESTVLDISRATPVVLRPGAVSAQEIARLLQQEVVSVEERNAQMDDSTPRAPGMKYRHYAPVIPVELVIAESPPDLSSSGDSVLVLTTERHFDAFTSNRVSLLSASSLYACFREAEGELFEKIVVYAQPGELPDGLLNRVRKAAEQT